MTTEEARYAVVDIQRYVDALRAGDGPDVIVRLVARDAHVAGVASGIRQAREAVQKKYDDDDPMESPSYWHGLDTALFAIDALGGEQ